MRADVVIVGQGLAGTLVAWELERAGLDFQIVDRGHATAASWAGAGIVNPVTGRRFVRGWHIEELLPAARQAYQSIGQVLGVPLWRDMRIRRQFAGEEEWRRFAAKHAARELEPYVARADEDGFWIEQAARVDLRALLTASRAHWRAQGRLEEAAADVSELRRRHALVIDCTGVAAAKAAAFATLPWEYSKGEVIEIEVAELAPEIIPSRGHWVLPVGGRAAWVGATHEPGRMDAIATPGARDALESSAAALLQCPFAITGQRAAVRVNAPDRRPVAGRSAVDPGIGTVNGLGAKGVLWAPAMARLWAAHLVDGKPIPAEVDPARFGGCTWAGQLRR